MKLSDLIYEFLVYIHFLIIRFRSGVDDKYFKTPEPKGCSTNTKL